MLRKLAGLLLLALAAFLLIRGASPLAVPLAFFGLALLGINVGSWFGTGGGFGKSYKSTGQSSRVTTDTLEMELDHDSGRMDGRCLKGRFAGRPLSSLSEDDLVRLREEIRDSDPQGAMLLEAYLDHFLAELARRER